MTTTKREAGMMGFKKTTEKYFMGVSQYHKNWLSIHAQALYAEGCGRDGYVGGKFPPRIMHPSRMGVTARWVMTVVSLADLRTDSITVALSVPRMRKVLQRMEGLLSDEELLCIQAALFGTLWGRVAF